MRSYNTETLQMDSLSDMHYINTPSPASKYFKGRCWAPTPIEFVENDKKLPLNTKQRKLKKRKRNSSRAARRINRR